ncbi:MAG: hypothetical protein OXE94_02560 [Aestuariivita sp.]|nr:hypothetical protein [Aestuariivita sp.]MCY4203704.1 hypothetical protein [Aestuariivita sp.]
MDVHIQAEETVATWLVADGKTLVAPQYLIGIGPNPRIREPYKWPDILAVRPKDKQILVYEVT